LEALVKQGQATRTCQVKAAVLCAATMKSQTKLSVSSIEVVHCVPASYEKGNVP